MQETALVYYDGNGGIAIVEGSEDLSAEVKETGIHDILEHKQISNRGLYRLNLSKHYESCDCNDCYPCAHPDYPVFEIAGFDHLQSN